MFGTVDCVWCFIGVSEGAMVSSDCDDVPTEVETRSQCRRRRAIVTRRLVPLAGGSSVPLGGSSHERSRELLEEAFDVGMYHTRCTFGGVPVLLLISLLRDFRPFRERSVATPIQATGHQLVTLSRSVCAEETVQNLEPIMSRKWCCRSTTCTFSV